MSFDQNLYAQLNAVDPAAAAQYLANAASQAAGLPPSQLPQAQPNLQQGFAQQAAAQPQIAARGTLEDFFNQPSGGGGPSVTSKFFNKRQQGHWLQMTVLSDVTNADVQHQKTPAGVLQYFKKNGQDDLTRPKLVLVVKVQVTGSSDGTHTTEFPDGSASVWLKKGPVTDDLIRAMTAAGDPSGFPKAGAQMVMQSAGEQASRTVGYNATKLYTFQYALPTGAPAADPTQFATASAPSIATATSVPPATAAPATAPSLAPSLTVPASAPPVPAVNGTATSAATTTPPVPTTAPSLTTPTVPVVAPTEVPTTPTPALAATTGGSVPPVPAANFTAPPAPPALGGKTKEQLLAELQGVAG